MLFLTPNASAKLTKCQTPFNAGWRPSWRHTLPVRRMTEPVMKTPSTPSTREESAGAECEVCRVVNSSSIDVFRDDKFPPEVYRLKRVYKLGCCPLCGTFYLKVSESDPHHYMSVEVSFKRISDEAAFGELVSMRPGDVGAWRKNVKQWLDEKFDTDARVRALTRKLTAEKTAETLANIYLSTPAMGRTGGFPA